MVPTKGLPVQSVGFEKIVYAPAPVKKAVMLGNYHGISSEANESLNAYDFETNTWSVLDKGGKFHSEYMPESGHPSGDFSYDPNQKVFIYLCCHSGVQQVEDLRLMWWYDPIGQSGRSKPTSLKLPVAHLAGSSFDASTGTYVLHGGGSFVGTWTYNPASNSFQKQATAGTPPDPSVLRSAVTYNTRDHKIYLFGGVKPTSYSNELFAYDAASNVWNKLNPGGPMPPPRGSAGFAYDSTNNVFLLYGGVDGSRVYNDTWVYDPGANRWTELAPPHAPGGVIASFEMLTYDSDHNVFILVLRGADGYADGKWNHYSVQTWLFRYEGTGPNAGFAQANPAVTPGALNRNSGWAKDPSLASSGDTLYAGWVETGRPFDTSDNTWLHTFTSRYGNGGWSPMGLSPTAIDSENRSFTESYSPSLAVIGGVPWVSWYKSGTSASGFALWAKRWNPVTSGWEGGKVGVVGPTGGAANYVGDWTDSTAYNAGDIITFKGAAWYAALQANTNITPGKQSFSNPPVASVGQGFEFIDAVAPGTCAGRGTATAVCRWTDSGWQPANGLANSSVWALLRSYGGRSTMADVGGKPYMAFLESQFPPAVLVYVKYWDGTRWVLKGASPLNVNPTTNSMATSVSITSDGTAPYVAWTEYTTTTNGTEVRLGPAKVYVARWDNAGNQWQVVGNGINANPQDNAEQVSLTWLNGQPYVAWTEKRTDGNNQLYVKTLSGGNWVPVSTGSMNKDTNSGWAYKPSLIADSSAGALYLGWVEQRAIGERAQSYVSRYGGGSWTALGASLNADPALGSAQSISVAILEGQPVAAWAEVNPGSVRQVFVKRWTGTGWELLTGTAADQACDINRDGIISTLDIDAAAGQTLGATSCGTADLQGNGTCNVVDIQRVINAVLGGTCKVGQ